MKGLRASPIGIRKRKMIRRCKMLWWVLLVLAVDAQQIRIPAYVGRTQNRPVVRVIPSDSVVIRVRKPDIPILGTSAVLNRSSVVTRIQPILIGPRVTPRISLLGVLSSMGLRKMATLVDSTQLQTYLHQAGPVTLFAPTDEAFSLSTIPNDQKRLRDFVLQHVVQGRVTPMDVRNDITLPSLRASATPLRLNVYEDGQMLSVSGSQFLDDPRDADNIRIQPIDRVLYPISTEDLVTEVKLTFPRMYEFLLKASLTPQLTSGTFTLFSPTEEAFAALSPEIQEKLMHNSTLLRKVLLNHVVPGTHYSAVLAHGYSMRSLGGEPIHVTNRRGLILVNGVPVVKTDISVTNGVIHAVNRLLLPPELYSRRRPVTMAPPFKSSPVPAPPPINNEYIPIPVYMEPPPPVPRTLTKTIVTPLNMPDGTQATFSTANSLLRRSLLLSTLRNNGSDIGFTMLVPTDTAYAALGPKELDQLRRNSKLLRRMLLCQMVEGRLNITSDGKEKDRPIRSLGGTIIISSFNGGNSMMIGGARVLSVRQAADGLVLVTDKVTFPPSPRTVVDALSPFRKFNDFVKSRTQIRDSLVTDGSVYTIFAPTDAALSLLSPAQLRDQNFISELFWSHVVPGAYYRTRLSPGLRLTTVRGNTILIHRSPSGALYVNEKPVTGDEITAGNGVIHPIDHLLFIPSIEIESPSPHDHHRVSSPHHHDQHPASTPHHHDHHHSSDPHLEDDGGLMKIAQDFNATLFLDWMHKAGIQNLLRSKALQKTGCTLFLPINSALKGMSPTLRSITLRDPERLKKFIRFHVSPQVLSWNSVYDNSFMPSLLPRKRIRCNIYAKDRKPGILTVSGCRVTAIRQLAPNTNVTVAVINDVMTPPPGDMPLTVAKTPMLTNFTKILKVSGMDSMITSDGPYTLFAPNACAFQEMDPEQYQHLITNRKKAIDFIKKYLVKGCYYSSGLQDGQTLLTEANTYLTVKITPECIIVSEAKVLYGDMSTTDGVLHVITSLITS
ncbi:periostin [Nephila pilipes]|uniref:Periostin n=1 Tax=Nephila pilipes TaxID=299642 RepID=A0A8X6PFD5_NEPPI|nr:periostin [Nephila pilipes]